MDTNTNLVSMSQQFSGLPMEDLIGGPLNAAAKANASMALTQTRFLMETCFSKNEDDSYNPVMIEMSLTRPAVINDGSSIKVENITTKFNLPLISVIAINSLGVDKVDITFEMEVKSSFSETEKSTKETESKGSGSFESKLGWGPLSVSIKGSASYSSKDSETHDTHYEKSNSAKYTVNVHAAQLPVPKGVNTIIEAFTQSIQPYEVTSDLKKEETKPEEKEDADSNKK